jgi:hypothetical protein
MTPSRTRALQDGKGTKSGICSQQIFGNKNPKFKIRILTKLIIGTKIFLKCGVIFVST